MVSGALCAIFVMITSIVAQHASLTRDCTFFCIKFINALLEDARLADMLSNPSVSYGAKRLYVRGVFEQETRPNLDKTMGSLVQDDNAILEVNDKKIMHTLKIRLMYQ